MNEGQWRSRTDGEVRVESGCRGDTDRARHVGEEKNPDAVLGCHTAAPGHNSPAVSLGASHKVRPDCHQCGERGPERIYGERSARTDVAQDPAMRSNAKKVYSYYTISQASCQLIQASFSPRLCRVSGNPSAERNGDTNGVAPPSPRPVLITSALAQPTEHSRGAFPLSFRLLVAILVAVGRQAAAMLRLRSL
jgi:hypothetical protein